MQWQGRSVRKSTGGRYHPSCGKRRAELGKTPAETHIGEDRRRIVRTHGGTRVQVLTRGASAIVADPATGRSQRVKIETVVENVANPNFVRRNLLTKGAIVRTELGNARITSRPGQDGVINAILVK
jgi:small subunit ribosomal protein S8e